MCAQYKELTFVVVLKCRNLLSWHKALRKEFCGENPKSSRFVSFEQVMILEWGAGMAQLFEHSPPTTVARAQFPDLASYIYICWWSLLLVLVPAPTVFL